MQRHEYTVRVTQDVKVMATDGEQAKRLALAHAINAQQTKEGEDVWLTDLVSMRTKVELRSMRS
jgi:hypothetical protein